MNRSGWRSHLAALLTAIIACVGLLSLSSLPAWAKAGTITEFPPSTRLGELIGITAGPDGNVWFTEEMSNKKQSGKIGRITTAGSITEFPVGGVCVPNEGCGVFGITSGPDGNLWFTEFASGKIGRITTAGSITLFPIPTANSEPRGITAGPDGNVWFTEENAGKIGRITTQ